MRSRSNGQHPASRSGRLACCTGLATRRRAWLNLATGVVGAGMYIAKSTRTLGAGR